MKIQGAAAPIASAKGVSTRAKMIDNGIAMITDTTPPEIAFCRAMWGMPSERSSWASRSIGTAVVSPGMPSRVVGTAWEMCLEMIAARKKAMTPAGGTPMRMTSRARGATIAVSSVPEMRPMPVNSTAASSAIPIAQRTGSSSSGLTGGRPSPAAGSRGCRRGRRRARGRGSPPGPWAPAHADRRGGRIPRRSRR